MDTQNQTVSLVDIQIPFWRLVAFFVKASIAAIPAAIILGVIYMAFAFVFFWLMGGHWM